MFGNHVLRARRNRSHLRVGLTLIGLVLVGLVPLAPAQAASSTITVSRSSVIGGESVNVTGKTGQKKARKVVLQRLSGKTWVTVIRSRSGSSGSYRFFYKPPTKAGTRTTIRVIAPKATIKGKKYGQITSPKRTITTVGQSVTATVPSVVTQGATFKITGKVAPARTGRTTVLQLAKNGAWTEVKRAYQSSAGVVTFSTSLTAQGTFSYRVLALAEDGAPAVASAVETVTTSLPAPTGLQGVAGSTTVNLSWTAPTASGITGYNVFRRTDNSDFPAGWTKVNPSLVTGTTYQATGLTENLTYYFSVKSVSATDESAFAPKISVKTLVAPDVTPPPAPTKPTLEPADGTIQVSWNSVVANDLAGYHVYRKTGPGTYVKVNTSLLAPAVTTLRVEGLTNGTAYTFAVSSVDTTGNESAKTESDPASPAPDTTPPPVPAKPTLVPGDQHIEVSWTAVAPGDLAGYHVYRKTASTDFVRLTAGPIAATTYDATGLVNGTDYLFAVTSVDLSGNESAKSATETAKPKPPPAGWSAVSVGLKHTCALATDSTVWCWGYNGDGQLGSTASVATATPTQVGSASDWTSVSAGDDSTCGVRSGGTLWCWGSNKYGQLGNGSNSGTSTANPVPVQVAGSAWATVSVGRSFACATRTDATLWCWGFNSTGQLGVALAGGADPLGDYPTPGQVAGTTWSKVSAGTDHACATTTGGTLSCWGGNVDGQLGKTANDVPNLPAAVAGSGWTTVSAGEYHTCGLQGGAASCWGSNTYGERGSSLGTGWTSINAGGDHTCGTKSDGVYCFGRNASGQLGKASNTGANAAATKVAGSTSAWTSAEAGGDTTCARTTGNKVFCWGLNDFGQVGNPAPASMTAPNPTPYDVLIPAG